MYIPDKKEIKEKIFNEKKSWICPCSGCSKAVKQERQRIMQELQNIDISKLNGLGMLILIKEIIND